MKRPALLLLCALMAGCSAAPGDQNSSASPDAHRPFGASVSYEPSNVSMADLSADVALSDVRNLEDLEKAYGFTLTAAEKEMLADNAFLMLPLTETSITPTMGRGAASERYHEFLGLYNTVRGSTDYKDRTPANALFVSSDIFLHSYNLLYTELLKEMENTEFFPAMSDLSATFYTAADAHYQHTQDAEHEAWRKVRNYFAVPYALLSTAKEPPTREQYLQGQFTDDPSSVARTFQDEDATADTIETATAFVQDLGLDDASEQEVLADLQAVYRAQGKVIPSVFKTEYEQYAAETGVQFMVDFSQFTPRSHYTGSSLRRQYFRSMMWFSQVPFFLKSPALTAYAFDASQLLAEHPEQLADYAKLESTINFLVGTSDDLMPADYLEALRQAEDATDQEAAVMDYLVKARPPKIKSLPAAYPTVGDVQTDDVVLLTKGMRFFSGKFIIDSYWTGQLTQGDEAVKPGYTQKLPPMASSLEVMALLGSDYARSMIPTLDFYTPETREAIDQAMAELTAETSDLDEAYWQSNLYNGWLWTIRSLFSWQREHVATLPHFMHSSLWPAKTLQTAAGFWTELRHATLLYAKQSFAELGGGPPGCDARMIPEPPKGYIEPQIEAYDRLSFLARTAIAGIEDLGFGDLQNMAPLTAYVDTLDLVRAYTVKQLQNEALHEQQSSQEETDDYGTTCTVHSIDGTSDWEQIRLAIVDGLEQSLPIPVDGPVLSAKDKRAALIADVHTGGDYNNPTRILYEATGVPNVIIVLVDDVNGPRATIGFTYAQYEFTEPYGSKRMTDEEWQTRFYEGDDPYDAFHYTDRSSWPVRPSWFESLFTR